MNILDIILFGSIIRGKEKPRDIDLLLIYTGKIDITDMAYELKKRLNEIDKSINITNKRYDELFNPEFFARESILSEGYSMRQKKSILESLGYSSFFLFKYSLKNMNKSKKMQFYYSLYGRGKQQGILKKNNCYKFSDRILISPVNNSDEIKIFLKNWKIEHIGFPIIMPKRVIKYYLSRGEG